MQNKHVVDTIFNIINKGGFKMRNVKKIGQLLMLGIVCMFMLICGCTNHYAILISTNEVSSDNVAYHSEWWYDLFLQYKMLRELGYEDEDIYVLYGNGTDFSTSYTDYNAATVYGHTITDLSCNKADIQNIFTTLSTKVDENDYLYVWWMGHGNSSYPNICDLTMDISHTGEKVTDIEFTTYLNSITSYGVRWVNIMTCHSGGMIDNLDVSGNKTITFTSSMCDQLSYDGPSCGVLHADFNYDEPTAYREEDPCGTSVGSDIDGSGSVNGDEAFSYITTNVSTSTPQKADPDGISASKTIEAK